MIHLLDGDGFAFTTAYLQARHGLSDEATRKAVAAAAATPAVPGDRAQLRERVHSGRIRPAP
ncbi:hypothetical protein [Saccharopolyspora pogona]|uniref:hypothetical protein n=1 Tax=Saccharopolyspora pogona TaxID=333966 RepID=UPI001CC24DAE|nr:hypothetical protein [Saccharopolyspora pogona]